MADSMTHETFIVLREPTGAREVGWRNEVKNWYDSEDEAKAEAERLCESNGKTFVVFKAIANVRPARVPVEWREGAVDPLEDLPF